MEKKLFAIKIPAKEKEAMDFTAGVTGLTLTKLYYKGLQNALYEVLGSVLLHHISPQKDDTSTSMVRLLLDSPEEAIKTIPLVAQTFVDTMESGEKEEFKKIFYNLKLVEKEDLLREFSIYNITRDLGHSYIDKRGSFTEIDAKLVENIVFEQMLRVYYMHAAVGSLKALQMEWEKHHLKVSEFRDKLVKDYEEKYGERMVAVVDEYEDPKDRKKRKS